MHANQQKNSNTLFKEVIIDIFKLHRIRYTLLKNYYSVSKINNTESQNKIINVSSLDKIKIVLSKAHKVVNEWNGLLYFIYLPPCDFYFKKNNEAAFKELDEIKNIVENLNIRFIDIHKNLFDFYDNPKIFFPNQKCNHYNNTGYKLIAEYIYNNII